MLDRKLFEALKAFKLLLLRYLMIIENFHNTTEKNLTEPPRRKGFFPKK